MAQMLFCKAFLMSQSGLFMFFSEEMKDKYGFTLSFLCILLGLLLP